MSAATATVSETQAWSKGLQRARLRGLHVGDVVYERVVYGKHEGNVKWNKGKVTGTNKGAARVVYETGRESIVPYGALWIEPPCACAEDKPASPPQPPLRPMPDDEYTAWLDMTRGMLDSLDQTRAKLDAELHTLTAQRDTVDATHRKRIESLEAELLEEKREHNEARAYVATRVESVTARLSTLNDRRVTLTALMGIK